MPRLVVSVPIYDGAVAFRFDEPGNLVTRKRIILLGVGVVMFLVVGFFGLQGARAWWAWNSIERIEFDTAEARNRLIEPAEPDTAADTDADRDVDATPSPTYEAVEYDTVLAIGTDFNPEAPDRQEGVYADAVLFWLAPTNGGDPVLVSLPRDLLVSDPCTGEETKLDRTLTGCGEDVSGPELVAVAVEDYTGIGVDHFAMFNLDGFVAVIDSIGGVEICVEHALREGSSEILPAGCSAVDGATSLRWVRSRGTQEFVDGEWRFIEDVSDVNRMERQQTLMFAMLTRLKGMRSPSALAGIAGGLGDAVMLSESLSMSDSVAMAWDLRSVPFSRIRRIVVPTEPAVAADGSFALRATVPFRELLEG
ncbi:MAG: LCP family protein [Actinomycetota bacterium]|nr:LCP family protein [Actinomycetota bacterium]